MWAQEGRRTRLRRLTRVRKARDRRSRGSRHPHPVLFCAAAGSRPLRDAPLWRAAWRRRGGAGRGEVGGGEDRDRVAAGGPDGQGRPCSETEPTWSKADTRGGGAAGPCAPPRGLGVQRWLRRGLGEGPWATLCTPRARPTGSSVERVLADGRDAITRSRRHHTVVTPSRTRDTATLPTRAGPSPRTELRRRPALPGSRGVFAERLCRR